jgi:4-hydroxybenzoate polyprenyltransferase
MSQVKNYLSLVKFSHTIFAMPFALVGFFLGVFNNGFYVQSDAWYTRYGKILILVILCMIFARSAAMAFNRYIDRNFDALNPRTRSREIPSGILKPQSVLYFTLINSLLFVATTFFINPLCFKLSPVALLVILGYSYTKRFTQFSHFVLGLGLSLAPIGAFIAVTGQFDIVPVLFSFIVLFWVSGFDMVYALQDENFDKENGLRSMPVSLGKAQALLLSRFLHVICAVFILIAGWLGKFGWWYWAGAVLFINLLAYQQSLVNSKDLRKINSAFMTTNGVASVIFSVLVIIDLFKNTH